MSADWVAAQRVGGGGRPSLLHHRLPRPQPSNYRLVPISQSCSVPVVRDEMTNPDLVDYLITLKHISLGLNAVPVIEDRKLDNIISRPAPHLVQGQSDLNLGSMLGSVLGVFRVEYQYKFVFRAIADI